MDGEGTNRQYQPVKSICPFCSVGCGLRYDVESRDARGWNAPVNQRGELCPKGIAAFDIVDHPDRLTTPLVRENGNLHPASWDEVLSRVERKFTRIVDEHSPDALTFFASSNCTNEENYLMQKLARLVGTNNVDNCTRLCHSSTVVAMADRFGIGAMTNTLTDLEAADVFLAIGGNPAEQHPIIFSSYLYPAIRNGTTLIHVDPRVNRTTRHADYHLPVRPGHDIPLLNAMCAVVLEEGLTDEAFVEARTEGIESFRDYITGIDIEANAEQAGVDPATLRAATRAYAEADRAAAFTGMGMSQHAHGTSNVHALLNLVLLTGNVGKRGTGVNPLRGKNNVQGASDVGAIPDMLPGYQSVTDEAVRERVATEWGVSPPETPGLTEVEATHAFGESIHGAYVIGENPGHTEPNATRINAELDALECLVVQDIVLSRTARQADVVLPASSWAEKAGTVTNTDRQVQRMRPTTAPIENARHDLEIICDIGRRVTDDSFDYDSPEAVFEELTQVTPIYGGMSYDGLGEGSQRWPFPVGASEGVDVLHTGTFGHDQQRASFSVVSPVPPADNVGDDELVLTTGRVLSHYNSGVITRRSDLLIRMYPHDVLQIHPEDAAERNITNKDEVLVKNERGQVEAQAELTPAIKQGMVFLTFHFAAPLTNTLTGDTLDPESRIPEYKHSAVTIVKRGE